MAAKIARFNSINQWRNNRACKACSARGPSAVGAQNLPDAVFKKFFLGRGGPFGILARGPTATLNATGVNSEITGQKLTKFGKKSTDPSSVHKEVSYNEKFAKIGPVYPEIAS